MGELGIHGPIDFMLIEFPGSRLPDEVGLEILDLVARDVVRLYDIAFFAKDSNGATRRVTPGVEESENQHLFASLSGARSGLVTDEDLAQLAAEVRPDSVALVIVYENSWAVPFVRAALAARGEVVASERIPAQEVIAVLDVLECAS